VRSDDDVIVLDDEGNARWINCCSIGRFRGIDGKHPKNQAKYDYYEAHPRIDSRKGRNMSDEVRRIYNKLTHGEKGNLSCYALTSQALGKLTHKDKKFWKGRGKRGNVARMNLASHMYIHKVPPTIFSNKKYNKNDDDFAEKARRGFERNRKTIEELMEKEYDSKKNKFLNEVKEDSDDEGNTRAGGDDDDDDDDDDDEDEDDEETEDEEGEDSDDDHSNSDKEKMSILFLSKDT
jgi:hypothetical protein